MYRNLMIKIIAIVAVIFAFGFMPVPLTQIPEGIPYQTVLRDGSEPIADQVVEVRFSIFQNGQQTYQETQLTNTNQFGLINVVIGQGTPTAGSAQFSKINWKQGPVELKVEMDYDQSGFQDFGTMPFLFVPYSYYANEAHHAKYADVATSSSVWSTSGNNAYRNSGNVGFGTSNPKARVHVDNHISITKNGKKRVDLFGWGGEGRIETWGSKSRNFLMANENGSTDWPYLALYDEFNRDQASLYLLGNGGQLRLKGPNGKLNVLINHESGDVNRGALGIFDVNGAQKAIVYVDANGNGIVSAHHKYFRIDHPTKSDSVIVYCSIEGGEAAAYERGTIQLKNGEAFVPFSEHFESVVNPGTMTVMLTPLSEHAKGLAVVEKTAKGFKVKELQGGKGNYQVDWEAKAVRKGDENFRVVRHKSEGMTATEGSAAKTEK